MRNISADRVPWKVELIGAPINGAKGSFGTVGMVQEDESNRLAGGLVKEQATPADGDREAGPMTAVSEPASSMRPSAGLPERVTRSISHVPRLPFTHAASHRRCTQSTTIPAIQRASHLRKHILVALNLVHSQERATFVRPANAKTQPLTNNKKTKKPTSNHRPKTWVITSHATNSKNKRLKLGLVLRPMDINSFPVMSSCVR
nr:hypothetical protein CFP56_20524 [Quercus suber]